MPMTLPPRVTVTAPARLHMGFLDLNGGLGRSFGSLGLTISGLATTVHAEPAESLVARGPEAERVKNIAARLLGHHGETRSASLTVEQAIPAHVGLGSGTQLALAAGTALARLFGWGVDGRAIAHLAGRGSRSGIGIGAFETGGFLVDGGRGDRDEPPRIVARAEFPAHWRILLIFDELGQGIHGAKEIDAFGTLPGFPAALSAELCRLTLMQALPSLQDHDIAGFGAAIGAIQQSVGDYFAPAQGGRYTSPMVTEALNWLTAQGIAGVGQSSWGPTGFVVVASETQCHSLLRAAQRRWGNDGPLSFMICSGRNRGGEVRSQRVDDRRRITNIN